MPGRRRIILLLLLTACCQGLTLWCEAQSPIINFRHIKSENGLSNSTIESILQDSRGFLWFGTRDGLNRYDGSQFQVYRNHPADTTSLSDNYITALHEDSEQTLWVGTLNGLSRFQPRLNKFTRYRFPKDHGNGNTNRIATIIGDSKGRVWVGTAGGGLQVYEKGSGRFRTVSCVLGDRTEPYIYALLEDSRGNLWAGTESGLYLYNTRAAQFENILLPAELNGKATISALAETADGRLLLGMSDNGLVIYHPSYHSFQHFVHRADDPTSLSSNLVRSVQVSKKGDVWIGSVNGGLDHLDASSGKFINYQYQPDNPNSLSQRTVSALYEDRQGNIWIGTHRGGINLYMPGAEKFRLYRQKPFDNSLSYNDVKSFCEDRSGNIWIGTDGGGLNLFNRKLNHFTHYKHDPFNRRSLGSNEVMDIREDREGTLWVATWGGGLCRYDPRTNDFTRFTSAAANYIQCIFEDRDSSLLIGTYFSGLHAFNKRTGQFSRITRSPSGKTSISGNNILSITQDRDGNIWMGTDDGGLNRKDAGTGEFSQYFRNEDKLPDIRVLFTDSRGGIWAGQAGLYKYDSGRNDFFIYTQQEGLADVFIKGMVEDNNGQYWITTSAGLKMLDTETGHVRSFNTGDGLQEMEFEANAFTKTRDGQIYIGGVNGFNSFNPKEIKANDFVPPVFVTDFQVQNHPVSGGSGSKVLKEDISFTHEITLSYKEATFSFGFAALSYTAAENNRFAYKLEGWDKDWIYTAQEKRASYTNVRPGTYTFTIKASNNDGIWNNQGYSIRVIITPPFWNTWWFQLLTIALLAGVLYYIYHIRRKVQLQQFEEQKKEEIHQMQLQFFTNISHEFRTPLSLITGPVEKLLQEDADNKHHHLYQVIHRNANRLLQLINELMDFRKAASGALHLQVMPGNLPLFLHEIAEEFSELALQKNIRFTVSAQTKKSEIWFDRQVLEKIITNLLSNAFKYTNDYGRVSLQLLDSLDQFHPQYENKLLIGNQPENRGWVYVRVSDNGIGISGESIRHLFERYYRVSDTHLGSGIGLAFVKTLTQLHHGNIYVYSERNKGTEIIIALPAEKSAYSRKERWLRPAELPDTGELIQSGLSNGTVVTPATPVPGLTTIAEGSRNQILIAEDNPELRQFLKESLESQYQVIEAADGREAMEKTATQFPDVVISDIMMPVMDGIEYCRAVKNNADTAHIPFILLTAKNGMESRLEGAETGADYYFSKPLRMDLLQLTLQNILSQKEKLKAYYRKDQHAEIRELAHSERDRQFLERLIAVIEENLSKPEMDIEYICTQIGMSRTKLYNLVKNITGQAIGDFIRTVRLKRAATLLTKGELSMSDIMYSVGIQTQSYFSKAFKQEFGKTPTQYLKDLEK
ncbi:hybrid sensor histidine kinase/response regulator transcription factor [Flavihumibacter petaseus]|uniref:histidine kinase n=1 Tax=Flavihumibacter petaseus NBRC 106054 TaxID=1220578 RepID=A0A0E9MV53_9BACT|nr:hybrid sensor histidine kinase/response regulator transcription factor [Flavihumibacter petaseus]GAO41005.1 putative two-component hybrid sensor and regulator [Flavihumibacter petaseus NBRC 106054]